MSGKIETARAAPEGFSKSEEARRALMRATERCIAENGLAGAPLKAIHAAAGQRNMSATQYHFGSREALIGATLDDRMPRLETRRRTLLEAEMAAHDGLPPLRNILAVWIRTLAEELHPKPEGNFYLRFIDNLRHQSASEFADRIIALQPVYATIFRLIDQHLAALPLPLRARQSRIGLAAEQSISALARLEADIQALLPGKAHYPAAAVELLVDYVTGGLTAPLSEASLAIVADPASVDFHLNFFPLARRSDAD